MRIKELPAGPDDDDDESLQVDELLECRHLPLSKHSYVISRQRLPHFIGMTFQTPFFSVFFRYLFLYFSCLFICFFVSLFLFL